jgi:hypothetical protein
MEKGIMEVQALPFYTIKKNKTTKLAWKLLSSDRVVGLRYLRVVS